MKAIGYARVSTRDQAENGASLAAQRSAIEDACERRGWELIDVIEDGGRTGRNMRRPGMERALLMLEAGEVDCLVGATADRMSRSLLDFASLLDTARRQGWAVVALDLGVDTTTANGEMIAHVTASIAQWERRRMSERKKEEIAERRRRDPGLRIGRERAVPPKTRARIKRLRTRGWSYRRIADRLDEEGVPTGHGGRRWWPATVKRIAEQRPERRR